VHSIVGHGWRIPGTVHIGADDSIEVPREKVLAGCHTGAVSLAAES